MRSVLCLLLLAGCPSFGEEDEIDEGEGLFCAFETLDLLAPGLVATNPFQRNERVYESQAQCWNLTTVKNRTKNTSTASITRIAEEGPPVLGCGFTGAGTVDQVTFTEGSCVLPSAMGHFRLTLTEPAPFELLSPNMLNLALSYQEVRGMDLIAGTGRIFLSRPMTILPADHPYDARIPVDPNASCTMPACSTVSFAGKGTVVSGGAAVCNELLASYASPFSVYFNADNAMSFDAAMPADSLMPGILDKATCDATTWLGERPYPFRRYHLDPASGTFTLDEVIMHQANSLADVCTIHWETTVTGC